MLIKHVIYHKLKHLRAGQRVRFGMCPMCNSDAPELYDCPVCNYYHGPFPPSKAIRAEWLKSNAQAIDAKLTTMKLVYKYKKIRKESK